MRSRAQRMRWLRLTPRWPLKALVQQPVLSLEVSLFISEMISLFILNRDDRSWRTPHAAALVGWLVKWLCDIATARGQRDTRFSNLGLTCVTCRRVCACARVRMVQPCRLKTSALRAISCFNHVVVYATTSRSSRKVPNGSPPPPPPHTRTRPTHIHAVSRIWLHIDTNIQ
jgi:hypothetical protein